MIRRAAHASWFVIALAGAGAAQVTQRVSVSSTGAQGNSWSGFGMGAHLSVSADGRFAAFVSQATNLVPGDTTEVPDVFVRDRQLGTTEQVSVDSAGVQGNSIADPDAATAISADGRFVAFTSYATNLVPGDTNGQYDVFVRDRQLGTTERVSLQASGAQFGGQSTGAAISADGRYVVFATLGTGVHHLYVRDRSLAMTEQVDVDPSGASGNSSTYRDASISADGRYIAFASNAGNLVSGDLNGTGDVFVRDRQLAVTELVSVDSGGAQANQSSWGVSISADGRFVAFASGSTNLVVGDSNGYFDIFRHDRVSGATVAVPNSSGMFGGDSGNPVLSGDGRYAAFWSKGGSDAAEQDSDVFVYDFQLGQEELVSVDFYGEGGDDWSSYREAPAITPDGRYVLFESLATNLVPADTIGHDVFLRDRLGGTSFTSQCDPGTAGVIACPCANPPSGSGRGCDNSSATGGAQLGAYGIASLSSDSLTFTAIAEKPTALSILTQWTRQNPTGAVYGMGVRCTAGSFKRLYTKSAVGGSLSAPWTNIDPQVSVRSAALGDTITAGQSRWYFVYYRDPSVLGGCSPASTFNATQTGRVDWIP